MTTTETQEFKDAVRLARLIPLGKDGKAEAVHRWAEQVKRMLAKPKGVSDGR